MSAFEHDLLSADLVDAVADWLGADDAEDRAARAAWSVLLEPGDGTAGELIAQHGAAGALLRARRGAVPEAAERWRPRWDPDLVRAAVARARSRGMTLVAPGDEAWPSGLDDLGPHAPAALWALGDPGASPSAPSVAIVGARAATPYGEHIAAELSGALAAEGVAIVSGAAYGIDGAAHRAALRAGGRTVAFVAGGADRVYPAGHAHLLSQISSSGAVVAECAPGTTPTRWRFLARNRLIAAMTDATIVVEAGARSGSINTAGHASALGRPVGAVPGPVTSSTSAGCHRLLREYGAVCITGHGDARELIGRTEAPASLGREAAETVRVSDALSRRTPRTIDELARRSGMAPREVSAALGLLALEGRAAESGAGWLGA
ncbi:DNA-processing protein DprA [Microbacterium sp. gxy059]|uniref:DNA-processing protein DprA n=1 Tax=Microbacterium sp. gxy059 TaxID=2957199 RepID=UPI003D9674F2